jgi:uncharacterized membrane protein/YHS domain-containing protein
LNAPPDIVLFFGRLHPLLVHLPIGFIVLLAALELMARFPRFPGANRSAGPILALAAPLAILTALCGWLLSHSGGYETRALWWHQWTGIGTAAACLTAALLYRFHRQRAYRWCLFSTFPLLVVASHFGGSLTHGSDYLVRYTPAPLRAFLGHRTQPPASPKNGPQWPDLQVFAGVIQPVLQHDCVSCHGPEKAKAGLRLDSLSASLKGGKSGPVIIPAKAAESEMLRRLRLPPEDDDHMPPVGKPQPAQDDLALLEWWIAAGAPADKTAGQLKPPENIARILAARFGAQAPAAQAPAAQALPPKPLSEIAPLAAQLSEELGIVLTPVSPPDPWLQCNAGIAQAAFGDAKLARLAPLGANLRWLDLSGAKVSDSGLVPLEAMPNLTRLHLERTAVTDAGLAHLAGLGSLEFLDLYGTAVTDAGLEQLQKLPRLKRLYLWQTAVTPAAANAFAEARPGKDQIHQWQEEIEQLQARIRDRQVLVDLGASLPSPSSNNSTPLNTQCPVSGKPADPAKTLLHQGRLVAFCCDDCKAKFQQDPKPYLSKLGLQPAPVSAKPADPAKN